MFGKKNIRAMNCKHVNTLGIKNHRQAIRAGTMHKHELSEPKIDVIIDRLNIAQAMAYKNMIARIPYRGSKIRQRSIVPFDRAKEEVSHVNIG